MRRVADEGLKVWAEILAGIALIYLTVAVLPLLVVVSTWLMYWGQWVIVHWGAPL